MRAILATVALIAVGGPAAGPAQASAARPAIAPAAMAPAALPASAPTVASSAQFSPEPVLRGDGTVDLSTGFNGSLNLAGYHVALDPAKGPVLSSAAASQPAITATPATAIDSGTWKSLGASLDHPLGDIHAVAVMGGTVYLGYDYGVIAWSGTAWSSLPTYSTVYALAVSGSVLYIGGTGDTSKWSDTGGIVAWNGTDITALGHGVNSGNVIDQYSSVHAIAVDGSTVYIGGDFSDLDPSQPAPTPAGSANLARWDGTNWYAVGASAGGVGPMNAEVDALAVDASHHLFAGGQFTNVKSLGTAVATADYIAEWTGSAWVGMGGTQLILGGARVNGALNGPVNAIALDGAGGLYAGGGFTDLQDGLFSDLAGDYVAHWSGTSWSRMGAGVSNGALNGPVRAFTVVGSKVYAGGDFSTVKNGSTVLSTAAHIAVWNGTSWAPVGTSVTGGPVEAIVANGTRIIAAGNFTTVVNGTTTIAAEGYASFDPATGKWASFGAADGSLNGQVWAIAVHGTDLYVGGDFTSVANGDVRVPGAGYIAKWNGSAWSALGSNGSGGPALNGRVQSIAVDAAGTVYAGGSFLSVTANGSPITGAKYIARWNGSGWSALSSDGAGGGSLDGRVLALALSGTNLYVGGGFLHVNDVGSILYAGTGIARWSTTAKHWYAMGGDGAGHGSLNGEVNAIAVSGTSVYAGGTFTNVNQGGNVIPEADYLARWDGSAWHAVGSNGAGDGSLNHVVTALAVRGSLVYAGGYFQNVVNPDGTIIGAADFVAVWNGSSWAALGSDDTLDGSLKGGTDVRTLTVDAAGRVYFGGWSPAVYNGPTQLHASGGVLMFDGTSWHALGSESPTTPALAGFVNAISITGSTIRVGGWFTDISNGGKVATAADWIAAFGTPTSLAVKSVGSRDGWVLESGEKTGKGGSINTTATTVRVGDDASKRQYVAILSFPTSSLPDGALVTGVTLKVRKSAIAGGGNPVTALGGFDADVVNGYFGTSVAVAAGDFSAAKTRSVGPSKPVPSSNWYTISLTGAAVAINTTSSSSGVTQVRLRFALDDNNNKVANYLALFSGNASTAYRPTLTITYLK
jgi:trimeric autotransporter adhesin